MEMREKYTKIVEIPFNSTNKYQVCQSGMPTQGKGALGDMSEKKGHSKLNSTRSGFKFGSLLFEYQ